jgi:predicted nuclease of restriction endonuclease-like (RecB) superfamily
LLKGKKSDNLYKSIKTLLLFAKEQTVQSINTTMLLTYFQIGKYIVEDEQKNKTRAQYASATLTVLSKKLTKDFDKGFSVDNLERFRKFYLAYKNRISATASRKLSGKSKPAKSATLLRKTEIPFTLAWSHYVLLLKIENLNERNFYEIEAKQNNWSVRELQRQYNASLYERILLSKNKSRIKQLAQKGQIIQNPTDSLKDHLVLEFLGLEERPSYTERELESAIINKLEHFMLEMGKGFLFAGRQKRFTFEGDSFFVDLVFYNRLLNCFVLLDLKIGKLTHQDIGQMQMYVNYYDRYVKENKENPTIGIVLCKEENKTVVEITLPESNNQIFAKEYKLYLPSKEQLKKQINAL